MHHLRRTLERHPTAWLQVADSLCGFDRAEVLQPIPPTFQRGGPNRGGFAFGQSDIAVCAGGVHGSLPFDVRDHGNDGEGKADEQKQATYNRCEKEPIDGKVHAVQGSTVAGRMETSRLSFRRDFR